MVGQGDRTHYARPAWTVLHRDPAGHPRRPPCLPAGLGHGLVPQETPNLLGYPRRGAPAGLVRPGFVRIPAHILASKTPARTPRWYRPRALSRRLIGQTQAK